MSVRKLLLELLCRGCFPTPPALLLTWVMLQVSLSVFYSRFRFTFVKSSRTSDLHKNQSLNLFAAGRQGCLHTFCIGCLWPGALSPACRASCVQAKPACFSPQRRTAPWHWFWCSIIQTWALLRPFIFWMQRQHLWTLQHKLRACLGSDTAWLVWQVWTQLVAMVCV